jgi:hypothetical protein
MAAGYRRRASALANWTEPGHPDKAGVSDRAGAWAFFCQTWGRRRVLEPRQPRRPLNPSGRPRRLHPGRAAWFRVSHKGEGIDDAGTIEGARRIVRGTDPPKPWLIIDH